MNTLTTPLSLRLPATLTRKLAQAGITTVGELLHVAPRRYYHWGALTPMHLLREGDDVTLLAEVVSTHLRANRTRGGVRLEVTITDGRMTMSATFFASNPHKLAPHERLLTPGSSFLFAGKVGSYRGKLQLTHPEFEGVDDEALTDPATFDTPESVRARSERPIPIYPAHKGVTSWVMSRAIGVVLTSLDDADIPDPLPEQLRERHHLLTYARALRLLHQPASDDEVRLARHTLRWAEALTLQTVLATRRIGNRALTALASPASSPLNDVLIASLPFTLTPSQDEAIAEISADLASDQPMQRLLEGDVGSGKTLVALAAMCQVIAAGHQAAFLAPTEVLAEQHAASLRELCAPLDSRGYPVDIRLLTSSSAAATRREIERLTTGGHPVIVVGTHALLHAQNLFSDLALVVIDEQHRFGVEQRDLLRTARRDGLMVHQLVMTATPIPRTVAMTVFGDLDETRMKGLPSGRTPVSTYLVSIQRQSWVQRMWERARAEIEGGGRVYVVCPRIDEVDSAQADEVPLASVALVAQQLRSNGPLADVGIEELTGQTPTAEKVEVMRRFASGESPVLVATTVIEVGVNVPESTMMVIMDAQQFGLSQLHQLRGRVGRSNRESVCMAVHRADISDASRQRLEAFAATTDGFALAEADLALRREGDVLGAQQSGRASSLRFVSVLRDGDLIARARQEAEHLIEKDPDLNGEEGLRASVREYVGDEIVWMERS